MDRVRRLYRILRLRGPSYLPYLATGYLLPRLVYSLVFESRLARPCQRILYKLAKLTPANLQVPKATGAAPRQSVKESHPAGDWLPHSTLEAATRNKTSDEPALLGRIDNDGRLLAHCGSIPGLDEIDAEAFVPRYRYDLDLVLDGDVVLVRKNFRGDRQAFRREWRSLTALDGLAGVPSVHGADEPRGVLYKSFVPGQTLRQRLVAAGARILSADTETEPELAGLGPVARIEAVWARGRECFPQALDPDFLTILERRLDAIHRQGVTGFSLSFGNVVLHPETQEPWFIDFDAAETHRRPRGLRFAACRNRDRDLFNRIYDRRLLTEGPARELAREVATPYAPFDFGHGLASRGFWSVDSGSGRWELVNRPALSELVRGRRILDLGSYNGLMPLLMLAGGARQVVAFERSPDLVACGDRLHRLLEWLHFESYDLDLRHGDMRAILDDDWGAFDIVTAFCSLYYLDEADMRRVVRRAAELASIMVLQAKTDTAANAADDKARKSSLPFLRSLLERHGFPRVSVIAPSGYPRPLLIGRKEAT